MERRRKHATRHTRGGLNESATDSLSNLPYLNEIIELGGISIGVVPPLTQCVAVAHEGRNTLAMLVRRKGQTLAQLLTRLDLAITRAQTEDLFTDEVNQAGFHQPLLTSAVPSLSGDQFQFQTICGG